MPTKTRHSAKLTSDLAATMARLRLARTIGDAREEQLAEIRLNWLIDNLGREETTR